MNHGRVTAAHELADTLARRLFDHDPFLGTSLSLREYDPLLPDLSEEAEQSLRSDLQVIRADADRLTPDSPTDRIVQRSVVGTCDRWADRLDTAAETYTVSAAPIVGAPLLFAVAARTVLGDEQAAADYLLRLRAAPYWLGGVADRLRTGRADGRTPVGTLVDQALAWCDGQLAQGAPAALQAPQPPEGWSGAANWSAERDEVITRHVVPALREWRDLLAELRPVARDDDRPGLGALPDGAELYRRCIAVHTTLGHSPEELHEIGLTAVGDLEARALELGRTVGLPDLPAIIAAVRASGTDADPQQSLVAARGAVVRAEARAAEMMPPPLPAPCAVEPMPPTVAESGMAPHYTRPRSDTGQPGTFWFNTMRPTAGSGWDLEAVAFHETVPGHHSQLARLQQLAELPLLLQLSVTVHSEGWGLYAERLAEEFDLYSDARARLGSVYIELHRAARLVVDTGLHALGWTRAQAVQYMRDHVALPDQFLVNEVDRYIAMPGQALAYLVGQREILRLRDEARNALGERFQLPEFHAAILDRGALSMPVLAESVAAWIDEVTRR